MSASEAAPFFFGIRERPLFGVLHRAAGGHATPLGLILCNPFGFEAISTHRTLRHIAVAAADAGIPALRFDYECTGDSAGGALDAGQWPAWVRSVHSAADELKQTTGCTRIVILGIRLGATLASVAASERTDVDSVIAIAPVVNAKAYVRELRAMQMASAAPGAAESANDDMIEAMGFMVTRETRAAMSAVDLTTRAAPPAPRVLVIDRDDLPGAERWSTQLAGIGVHVERHVAPGYVDMMVAPHSSVVPAEMLRLTRDWLTERRTAVMREAHGAAPVAAASRPLSREAVMPAAGSDSTARVCESVEFVDATKTVVGVLTTPAPGQPSRGGILLLSAGATHRIGPSRLYVTLARQWATLGYTVFRMDVSGIGDSRPHVGEPENVVYTRHAGADVARTASWLRERAGVAECYALGLCAGAYHAFKAAVGGVPLDGVVLINPLTFFWKDGMSLDEKLADQRVIQGAAYYRKNAFSAGTWRKMLRGEVNVLNVLQVVLSRGYVTLRHSARDLARRLRMQLDDDLGRELEFVAGRGTNMVFVFADHEPGIELLRMQGGSTVGRLRGRQKLELKIIPGADHTFTALAAREKLTSYLAAALPLIMP